MPEKLERQLAKLEELGGDYALVYCYWYMIDCFDNILYEMKVSKEGQLYNELLAARSYNFVGSMSFPLIRTKCLQAAGEFDELMASAQDLDMWLRLAKHYKFSYVPEFLVNYYYEHGEHIGKSKVRVLRGLERIYLKNEKDMFTDKLLRWKWLRELMPLYLSCGEYRNMFRAWLKTLTLQPARILSNLCIMRIFITVPAKSRLIVPAKLWLRKHTPVIADLLRRVKRKLKGENVNWYRLENKH